MQPAICVVPVSPLRAEPSHRSEMVTQQLFGEYCSIAEYGKDHWIRIKCHFDGYEGWCQDMHVMHVNDTEVTDAHSLYTGDIINPVHFNDQPMMLPFGCKITDAAGGNLTVPYETKVWNAATANPDEETIHALFSP